MSPRNRWLSWAIGSVLLLQSSTGLLWHEQYRDIPWIKATWFGNDWVTLAVGFPLFVAGCVLAERGSHRGLLLWLGLLGHAVYNYSFYLFGASLNAFFPLYVLGVVSAAVALIDAFATLDASSSNARLRPTAPVRAIGGALVAIGAILGVVWLSMWAAFVFAGRPTPIEPEAFKIVAALDLTLMVPALTAGGLLLWRRRVWALPLAAIASIQGALYLLVLSVNSAVAINRNLAEAPGELPLWGTLMVVTGAAAFGVLKNVADRR